MNESFFRRPVLTSHCAHPASIRSLTKSGCRVAAVDITAERKMKGLVVAEPWVSLIISGEKIWEMRSRNTLVRGRIALIRKGSKTVIGIADLVRTLPKLTPSELKASVVNHRVPESEIGKDFKQSTAWVLQHARPLREPVPYRHPVGAVIWVNLDPEVAAMVEKRLALG